MGRWVSGKWSVGRWVGGSVIPNYISGSTLFKKVVTLDNVTYSTVNFSMDIFLQALQSFQNQADMFYQNHPLTLYTVEIFFNSVLRKKNRTFTWKISNCLTGLTGLGLTLWYNGLELEKYLNYRTWLGLILWLELDLRSTQTTLLDLDWFYDILDLDLKSTWTYWTLINFSILVMQDVVRKVWKLTWIFC